jgi:ketosteroid isomerase-like protein
MTHSRWHRVAGSLWVLMCVSSWVSASPAEASAQDTLWGLERSYWRYVQANDLSSYVNLWHKDFLGWPSVSPAPVRKDHITDWITSQTSQGLTFHGDDLQPADIQVTGDIVMVFYRMTYKWLDKDGKGAAHTIRVTHTWLKEGKTWKIIGGMSAPEPLSS